MHNCKYIDVYKQSWLGTFPWFYFFLYSVLSQEKKKKAFDPAVGISPRI